jgi:hypothetical protein
MMQRVLMDRSLCACWVCMTGERIIDLNVGGLRDDHSWEAALMVLRGGLRGWWMS